MYKGIVGIVTMFFLISSFSCKKNKYSIPNPKYAIGEIGYYQPGLGKSNSMINYSYYISGTEYFNQYGDADYGDKWVVLENKNYKSGDKYMVEYNPAGIVAGKEDEKNSRMLFDYPVKDSTDYKSYVTEFKTNPPK